MRLHLYKNNSICSTYLPIELSLFYELTIILTQNVILGIVPFSKSIVVLNSIVVQYNYTH